MHHNLMNHTTVRHVVLPGLLLVALLGVLTACGSSTTATSTTSTAKAASIPAVTITAKDFSYVMPSNIPAGLVAVTMINKGSQPHQAQLLRLDNGVTPAQFQAALHHSPAAVFPIATLAGGPNSVMPGTRQQVILNLAPGQYAVVCFDTDPATGKPHYELGMVTFFRAATAPGQTQASAPKADGAVTLQDFRIGLPGTATAGQHTWQVTNNGPQPHELAILKLAAGKGAQDLVTFLLAPSPAGPPPFSDAGGMGALTPSTSGWVKLTLTAGNYVALCFVPDRKTGKPHFMLGMLTPFTVQ
jgi:hypothetical protein